MSLCNMGTVMTQMTWDFSCFVAQLMSHPAQESNNLAFFFFFLSLNRQKKKTSIIRQPLFLSGTVCVRSCFLWIKCQFHWWGWWLCEYEPCHILGKPLALLINIHYTVLVFFSCWLPQCGNIASSFSFWTINMPRLVSELPCGAKGTHYKNLKLIHHRDV